MLTAPRFLSQAPDSAAEEPAAEAKRPKVDEARGGMPSMAPPQTSLHAATEAGASPAAFPPKKGSKLLSASSAGKRAAASGGTGGGAVGDATFGWGAAQTATARMVPADDVIDLSGHDSGDEFM